MLTWSIAASGSFDCSTYSYGDLLSNTSLDVMNHVSSGMKNYITKQLSDSIEVKKQILENSELLAQIEQVAVKTIEAYKNNKNSKCLACKIVQTTI